MSTQPIVSTVKDVHTAYRVEVVKDVHTAYRVDR